VISLEMAQLASQGELIGWRLLSRLLWCKFLINTIIITAQFLIITFNWSHTSFVLIDF
jgi:hypothetical protein